MNELIPAILVQDERAFRERLALVERDFPVVQIDVMDGAFVPNRTWFDADVLRGIATPTRFELHLMVQDPKRIVDEVRDIETVVRAIWHVETPVDHEALIEHCHALGKKAGLAISPKTPIDALAPYADTVDEILVMGAEPGFSGQTLNPQTIERARQIHERWPTVAVGFDINVNAETIPRLKDAGVSRFCAASAIFNAANPLEQAKKLHGLVSN